VTQVRAPPPGIGYDSFVRTLVSVATGDESMFSLKSTTRTIIPADPDVADLQSSMETLSEVVRQLSERVEILEAREVLHRARLR
jgi:hypothetical protein